MDSYVIRIYRRDGKKSRFLVGTVEAAGTGRKLAFSNIEELWEILRCRKVRSLGPDIPAAPCTEGGDRATGRSELEASAEGARRINRHTGCNRRVR